MTTTKSIEQKAKAYDEALERARKINSGEGVEASPDWTICEVIFPELRENGERVKQSIVKLIKMSSEVGGFALHKWEADEMLAWLDKNYSDYNF